MGRGFVGLNNLKYLARPLNNGSGFLLRKHGPGFYARIPGYYGMGTQNTQSIYEKNLHLELCDHTYSHACIRKSSYPNHEFIPVFILLFFIIKSLDRWVGF